MSIRWLVLIGWLECSFCFFSVPLYSECPIHFLLCLLTGKNWDVSAALSDFEQLRQVHAGNLPLPFSERSGGSRTPEKGFSDRESTRLPRPTLQRQDDIVQGSWVTEGCFCLQSRKEGRGLLSGVREFSDPLKMIPFLPLLPSQTDQRWPQSVQLLSPLLSLCTLSVILYKGLL